MQVAKLLLLWACCQLLAMLVKVAEAPSKILGVWPQ